MKRSNTKMIRGILVCLVVAVWAASTAPLPGSAVASPLDSPIRAENILPPGNSGFVSLLLGPSSHIGDQLSLFADGGYKEAPWFGGTLAATPKPGVVIQRDEYGVPKVTGDTLYDTFFGVGYAMAQDRLYQAEFLKRAATGTLAELLGPAAVNQDKVTRRDFYTPAELAAQMAQLDPEELVILQAFADGMNAYIEEALLDPYHKMPIEFLALGATPSPWTPEQSAAILAMGARSNSERGGTELENAAFLQYLQDTFPDQAEDIFEDIFYVNDPAAFAIVPKTEGLFPSSPTSARGLFTRPVKVRPEVVAADIAEQAIVDAVNEPFHLGSNGWVVGPKKTAHGGTLLNGGPGLGRNTPSQIYEIEYHGPGLDARGMTFPGFPQVMIGWTPYLAWTIQSGFEDLIDIFVEELNPENQYQYRFNGEWVDMEVRTEVIPVRGRPPVTFPIYSTIHGPVIQWDVENNIAYTKARAARGVGGLNANAILAFQKAGSFEDVVAASDKLTSTFDFMAADKVGNIYYFYMSDRVRIRAEGVDQRLPTVGTGEFEWQGFLPREQMPHAINPTQGILIGFNSKPAFKWDTGDWASWGGVPDRPDRAFDLHKGVKTDFAMEKEFRLDAVDTIVGYGFRPLLLEISQKVKDPYAAEAVSRVAHWDGHMIDADRDGFLDDGPAQKIFLGWQAALKENVLRPWLGPYLDQVSTERSDTLLYHILQGKEASLPPRLDYLMGAKRDEVVAEALTEALDALADQYGSTNFDDWQIPTPIHSFATQPGFAPSVPPYADPTTRGLSYIQILQYDPE